LEKLDSLKAKIGRLNTAFTEGTLGIEEFKELKNPLVPKRVEIEQEIIALQTSKADRLEPLRNWISEANEANQWLQEENLLKMKSFLLRVGSDRLLRAQTLTVSFKSPWHFLAETNLAVRRTGSVLEQNSIWWRRGELNPCPRSYRHKLLHVYPMIKFKEPSVAPAHCRLPSIHEIPSPPGAVAPPND
jgi:hypothetical protein